MTTEPVAEGIFKGRPRGLLKLFFKMPLYLHQIGIVWWIEKFTGAQWILITTTGRKSGKPRQVMVDVMKYDKETDTYYVEAAYGHRADWVRNIKANPVFHGQVGRRKFEARAVELTAGEGEEMLVAFYRNVPKYARAVMSLGGLKVKDEAELRALTRKMLVVAIKPQ
ncbi:MAG: nitroreductase family deazaflavin-dependent oxidoreductase [Chloroflexi bacterium]|nr:nitroreductase family deazaflavin-dependent oxidoreductase [Chloroflexota bacterium]